MYKLIFFLGVFDSMLVVIRFFLGMWDIVKLNFNKCIWSCWICGDIFFMYFELRIGLELKVCDWFLCGNVF